MSATPPKFSIQNIDAQELATDFPIVMALYLKVKAGIKDPSTLNVQPPVNPGDSLDGGLACGQALTPDFIQFVRTLYHQGLTPPAA